MTEKMKLREQWPWNPPFLRMMLVCCTLFSLVATTVTYPFSGVTSFWFLTAIPCGLLFRVIYGIVAGKVTALKGTAAAMDGEAVESLMAIGRIESPGLAVLREKELVLLPLAGNSLTIRFSEIHYVAESRMLPGKFVWGKKAFHLETAKDIRIAFAVAESIGRRWSKVLSRSS